MQGGLQTSRREKGIRRNLADVPEGEGNWQTTAQTNGSALKFHTVGFGNS